MTENIMLYLSRKVTLFGVAIYLTEQQQLL